MALRDWHSWQIGVLWAIGIGITWVVGRLGVTAVSGDVEAAGGQVTGAGAPLWTTVLTLLILTLLLIVTVRWVKGRILDD